MTTTVRKRAWPLLARCSVCGTPQRADRRVWGDRGLYIVPHTDMGRRCLGDTRSDHELIGDR